VIRNEDDLENHINYTHWNPIKHGFVHRPEDWRWSSYQHWLKMGFYGEDWSLEAEPSKIALLNFE
jgi:putative transposase